MPASFVRPVALAVLLLLALTAGGARAADTVVTFGFDDGLTSEFTHRTVLDEHGIRATFFINSGKVGDPNRMSWADIAQLAAEGHEIGGHTVDHIQLTTLDQAGQTHQICDDKTTLQAHGDVDGYTIRNLAYPFGLWNATTKVVAAGCGYDTGRTTGGTDWPNGPVFAETFPPSNAYTLRAIMPRLTTPLATWQDIVQKARDSGGGWVNIVMHDLCDAPCAGFDQYSVDVALFDQVLDWLDTLPDVKIRTTAKALAVSTDVTAPAVSLTEPDDGDTVTGTVAISADASDAVGIDHVDFLIDGDVVGTDATAPYSADWDSSSVGDSATITAEAFDEADNATTSAARTVTVAHPDVTPPAVGLTAPDDGDTVTGTVTLSADATDDRGVTHVDFTVDGDIVATDATAPYSVEWDSSEAGNSATITAEAFDEASNSTVSASRTVTVTHPVDPPPDDPPPADPPAQPPVADPPVVVPPILDPPPVVPPALDTRAPSVRVADVVLRGDRLEVRVDARDAGGVSAVRVLLPGGVVRADRSAPFAVSWWARAGRHTIAADAIDRAGNRRRSAPIRVEVRRTARTRGTRAALAVTVRR